MRECFCDLVGVCRMGMVRRGWLIDEDRSHLLARRAQALDGASVLVQANVGLLKQAVDDINDAAPRGV